MAQNQGAFIIEAGKPMEVKESTMPEAGPGYVVVRNHAVATNPIEILQQSKGVLVQDYMPLVIGNDLSGEVYAVGPDVTHVKPGDRVIGHAWAMKPDFSFGPDQDAAFNLYTRVRAGVVAKLPSKYSFAEGAVMPLGLDTAIAGLDVLGLTPSLNPTPSDGVLVVYGGSSSVGLNAIQLAVASGARVITIASSRNHALCKKVGASETFDYKDHTLVENVIESIGSDKLVGIYDTISEKPTYAHSFEILEHFGGGKLVCTHPDVKDHNPPAGVTPSWILGLGEFSFDVWKNFVPQALESGQLKCVPEPLIVGKGLNNIQKALERHAEGVSAQKVVVEL